MTVYIVANTTWECLTKRCHSESVHSGVLLLFMLSYFGVFVAGRYVLALYGIRSDLNDIAHSRSLTKG